MARTDAFFVVFPDAEADRIRAVGVARQQAKRGPDRRVARESSSEDTHIRGYAAECALAAFLGVPPHQSVKATGNGGVSLRAHGLRFAVRHNTREGGDLRYMPGFMPDVKGGVPDVDVHVLVTGDLPVLALVGWAARDEVLHDLAHGGKRQAVTLRGYGERWLVLQRELRPIRDLLTLCRTSVPPGVERAHAAHLAGKEAPPVVSSAPSLFAAPDLFSAAGVAASPPSSNLLA